MVHKEISEDKNTQPLLRIAELRDLEKILEIQSRGYDSEYIESRETFEKMIRAYNSGCVVAENPQKGIVGYLLSRPAKDNFVQELNSKEIVLPDNPDCLYFHDVCIHPVQRKSGVASFLISKGIDLAKEVGLTRITCVSINDSYNFFQGKGFTIKSILESYGGRLAYFMEKNLIQEVI